MFLSHVAIGAAVALALFALVSREWKTAMKRVAIAIGLILVAGILMGVTSVVYVASLVDGVQLEPSGKARLLAETISTQMNFASGGLLLGLVVGGLRGWHQRPRRVADDS
jgi:hypothetical protein